MKKTHSPESARSVATFDGLASNYVLSIVAALMLLAALSIYLQAPPAPLPDGAPTESFSAGRALNHLRGVARAPHPLGTAAHDALRDYIVGQLNTLGLNPELQTATGINAERGSPYQVGNVQNILGRIPGTSSGRAVLLVAHYDSVANSPGASDDGSGVASLLETARALKAAPPLKNDVLFLFTDGEEGGLLGAEAFAAEHPAAKGAGVVLNFEARGSGGPVVMFEASDRNGWLVGEFAAAAPHPVANSLSYEIYKRLPNDTDLTVFKRAGLQGLNFAYIDHISRYHTAADSVENIDPRSLQAQGDSALALARHFGALGAAPQATANAVYFNLIGPVLVRYPQWLAAPLAALAALLFVWAAARGFKRGQLRIRGVLFGFVALLLCGIAAAVIVTLAWVAVKTLHRDYDFVPWGDVYNGRLYALAFVFLATAITSAMYNWFRRKTDAFNLMVGALAWWLLPAILTSLAVPGASYLFTWPLLFALLALLSLPAAEGAGRARRLLLLALYALPGVILLAPVIRQMFAALPLAASGVIVLLEILLLALLLPHLDLLARRGRWRLPGACAFVALALILTGLLTAGYDRLHPKSDNLFYVLDADAGTALWASADRRPDEWTAQFFGNGAEKDTLANIFPLFNRTFMKGAAAPSALAAPQVALLDERTEQGVRTLRLHVTSPRGGSVVSVYADAGGKVSAASIDGKRIEPPSDKGRDRDKTPWALTYYGFPARGVDLTLSVEASRPLKLRVDDRTYGLPQLDGRPVGPRPDYIIPSPSPYSDVTLVSKSYTF
ncbi:MAG TPA: M20/M25/M40 family metallo-hydrolase [Pyrinomonadaceae bacterium]|jgi:hypothetical protein